jgi:hypothetical protein
MGPLVIAWVLLDVNGASFSSPEYPQFPRLSNRRPVASHPPFGASGS